MTYTFGPPTNVKRMFVPVGVKTGNYTLKAWEFVEVDATSNSSVVTLPTNVPVGTEVLVKRIDAANTDPTNTNTVAIVPGANETLRNGLGTNTSIPLTGSDQSRLFVRETATQWTAVVDDPLPSLYPRFGQLLYTQTAVKAGDTITATSTNETAFASQYTIPANSLSVGQTIEMKGSGVFTVSTAGPSQRPRVRLGSALLIDVGALSLLANTAAARYDFDCLFTVRAIGTSGSIECVGGLRFVSNANGQATVFVAGPTAGGGETANPVPLDTTVPNTLRLTTQYSAATAGNTNTLRQMSVTSMKAPTGSN